MDTKNRPKMSIMSIKPKTSPKRGSKNQVKKWSWSKPKDYPKRPLSAYNIFFAYKRSRIINGLCEEETTEEIQASIEAIIWNSKKKKKRNRKGHGQVDFGDLAKIVSKEWNEETDENLRALFQGYADAEKLIYEKQVSIWKGKNKVGMKKAEPASSSSNSISDASNKSSENVDVNGSSSANLKSSDEADNYEYSDIEPIPLNFSAKSQEVIIGRPPVFDTHNDDEIETRNDDLKDILALLDSVNLTCDDNISTSSNILFSVSPFPSDLSLYQIRDWVLQRQQYLDNIFQRFVNEQHQEVSSNGYSHKDAIHQIQHRMQELRRRQQSVFYSIEHVVNVPYNQQAIHQIKHRIRELLYGQRNMYESIQYYVNVPCTVVSSNGYSRNQTIAGEVNDDVVDLSPISLKEMNDASKCYLE